MTASPAPVQQTLTSYESASLAGEYADYADLTLLGTAWASATGNAYDNKIVGNASTNILDGGLGDDVLTGGGSNHEAGHVVPRGDTFIIRAGEGNDTITDFTPGVDGGDVISLPGFDFRSFGAVIATASNIATGGVLFQLSATQTLTVHGLVANGAGGTRDLLISDFIPEGKDFDYTANITDIHTAADGNGGTVAVLTGTAEANSWVFIKDPTSPGANDPGLVADPQVQADATGVWHFTTAALSAGAHSFAVASVESKVSPDDGTMHYFEFTTSGTQVVTVGVPDPADTTPPAAPVLQLAAASDTGTAGDGITGDTTPTLTGTAEAGSTVILYDTDGTTVLGTTTASATDGNWSLTTGVLAAGLHHLTATATDAASNISPAAALDLTISTSREADFPAAGFDSAYYLAHNPDVAQAGVDPLQHYEQTGWHEGRDPNAFFHVEYYLNQNPDVAAAGIDPLQHYVQSGWQEGRDPSANFDSEKYLAANADVKDLGMDPLVHYLVYGEAEGRAAFAATPHATGAQDPLVDNSFYFSTYTDVAAAGVDPSAHYAAQGWQEGRNPDAWFDTAYYLAHNQDVAAAGINPLQHYEEHGWTEGRDPSANFSTSAYLAANPDVERTGMDPLLHYLQYGIAEHRDIGIG